ARCAQSGICRPLFSGPCSTERSFGLLRTCGSSSSIIAFADARFDAAHVCAAQAEFSSQCHGCGHPMSLDLKQGTVTCLLGLDNKSLAFFYVFEIVHEGFRPNYVFAEIRVSQDRVDHVDRSRLLPSPAASISFRDL